MRINETTEIYLGDCLEEEMNIEPHGVDLVLTDPPYGVTRNRWDSVIPFEGMWKMLHRVAKPTAAICLCSQVPFTASLIGSNLKEFRYEVIWKKSCVAGFLNARRMPLKVHENICVFYQKLPKYNPQMTEGKPYVTDTSSRSSNYGQMRTVRIKNTGTRYPTDVIEFKNPRIYEMGGGTKASIINPTQKPVELMEYFINTFSDEGDVVLDFAMGSGTTGIACMKLRRRFIGIEKDPEMFKKARARLEEWNLNYHG